MVVVAVLTAVLSTAFRGAISSGTALALLAGALVLLLITGATTALLTGISSNDLGGDVGGYVVIPFAIRDRDGEDEGAERGAVPELETDGDLKVLVELYAVQDHETQVVVAETCRRPPAPIHIELRLHILALQRGSRVV
ncbi:hypothetical protein LCE32_20415 [Streptomyces sp. 7G]|uniref:hypothetical protein n=1 Tax=Streptomyces sp. 7G TaxID=2877241 RepID=UPI001CD667A8|nr:hypothetical protein [Streptomyces sp. 7G]MCA1272392.1 hypothetical protein [Streptomyces sp. 7G]